MLSTLSNRFARTWFARTALLTVLITPALLTAQEQSSEQEQWSKHIRYTVRDLGTLPDGPLSQAVSVSTHGLVNGASTLPDGTQHAVLWYKKSIADLATPGLGGPNSGAFGANENGQVAGLAETSNSDPNGRGLLRLRYPPHMSSFSLA
jgi:uncharacterized membrane protein